MGEKVLSPAIRFNGYSDAWEQRKLSEIVTEKLSNGVMNRPASKDSNVKHINVVNMYAPDMIHTDELTFSDYGEKIVQNCNVEVGDIFMTRSSLKPEGIAEPNVLLDSGAYVFDDHLIRMKIDKTKYNPIFVKINLGCAAIKSQFIMKSKTTAFTTIGQDDISDCAGYFPQLTEQEQIGNFFRNLDHLITLHQRKFEKLQNVKKSMLGKMFPQNGSVVPEIRFAGFTDAWEQRKLGELASVSMNRRIFKEQTTESGDIPFFKIGTFGGTPDAYISQELFEEYRAKYPYPKLGDILISASGSIGRTVEYSGKDEYFQDSNIVWLNHDERIDNSFLKCFYTVVKWAGIEGSTIKRLYNDNILNTEISLPITAEQKQIGAFFHHLDHLITLHQRELEKLRNIKKSCLEKMFV